MKTWINLKAIWVTVLLFATISNSHGSEYSYQIQARIQYRLNAATKVNIVNCGSGIRKAAEWVREFYTRRIFAPAWIDEVGLTPEATLLINTISHAEGDGLSQSAYPLESIDALTADVIFMNASGVRLPPDQVAQLDIALSTAFFLHALYLSGGRVDADYFKDIQNLAKFPTNLVNDLENALANGTFGSLLANLAPTQRDYNKLKAAKKRYENIVAAGGWPQVPSGSKLEMGYQNARVVLLRERLMFSRDLNEPPEKSPGFFDQNLKQAVERFQKRHGLNPDGVVGPATLRALNVTSTQRLEQILINLERWHQLPRNLGENYIEVNIPDFQMKVVDHGKVVQTMRVVVGRTNRPTPLLSGRMTYLEVNPYWTVPPQIARKDLLPKIQKDPSYLVTHKIRVFENWQAAAAELDPFSIDWNQFNANRLPYKLRQEPTVDNALGKVKFMFPNKLSVYLHDTPSKEHFKEQQRSYSSGCVRLERPLDLAAYLVETKNGWDRQRLDRLLKKGTPEVILLKAPVPVYLLYWTAWVDEEDIVHFRNDLYGRDQALAQSLKKQPPDFKTCQNSLLLNPLMASSNENKS